MAQVKVNYLILDGNYCNGQSLVSKEEAMMSDKRLQFYLDGAEERGLTFRVETEVLNCNDDDAEAYEYFGYQIL